MLEAVFAPGELQAIGSAVVEYGSAFPVACLGWIDHEWPLAHCRGKLLPNAGRNANLLDVELLADSRAL